VPFPIMAPMPHFQWDLFCRVVDNFGDVGFCWRLAANLAARGERVRLWIDDASALAWMAPGGAAGVEVKPWPVGAGVEAPGDVVIEAFGCELPEAFVRRMASALQPPLWINLEYLSAEGFVERVHGLPSPQTQGAGAGLRKFFFYPGFTPRTGGLIREPSLMQNQAAFDKPAWLAARGISLAPDEQMLSLFCYEQPTLSALLDQLATRPTLLLAAAGHAARQVTELLGTGMRRGALRAVALPLMSQAEYDHLLWASDLNFVRGEDSFVRAQWAAKPFVWQIYPQPDGVHLAKLDAFLARFGATPAFRNFWRAWNGDAAMLPPLPATEDWRATCGAWRASLLTQPDLAGQLIGLANEPR
jgi:uncharacterized repeat protein (TIGR03837 family)